MTISNTKGTAANAIAITASVGGVTIVGASSGVSIETVVLNDGKITSSDVVSTTVIEDDAVTYAKMQHIVTANRVLGSTSADGAVTETQVETAMIANDAVTNAKMADNSVDTAEIKNNAVTNAKMADDSVDTAEIKNNAVTNAKMADDSVNTSEIKNNAVTNAKMADDSVDTAEIKDNAVTNAKMADDSVDTAEIKTNAITNAKMADNSVDTAEIKDDAITNAKMANMAVNTIKGRKTAGDGDPEDLSAADVRAILNVENNADVTDATNVAAAGAIMDGDFSSNGFMKRTGAGSYTIDTNTYLTQHPTISAASGSDNSGRTYIQDIGLDGNGHVTSITTATETVVDTDTNTQYSAGTGLSLSGTTFSLPSNMKTGHGNTEVGGASGEYTYYDDSNALVRWYVNSNERMRLDSNGELYLDASTTINYNFSDRRLKTNIQKIDNALETVMKLNGVTFDWRLDGKSSAGVIAQEVENIFPSAVGEKLSLSHNDEIFKTVEYNQLIGLLIEAVKDLNRENQKIRSDMENRGLFIEAIKELKQEIEDLKELKQEIEDLKAKNADILKMIN
jgi:hypothetical protein